MEEKAFYCDTNILDYLVKNPDKWANLRNYFHRNNGRLVISPIQVIEFKKVPKYHAGLTELLYRVPSSFSKSWMQVLAQEIALYPNPYEPDFLHSPTINQIIDFYLGKFGFQLFLGSDNVDLLWDGMDAKKRGYMELFSWLPTTLPAKDKIDVDFHLHNYGVVIGEIQKISDEFTQGFRSSPDSLNVKYFRGVFLAASYVYYRYILRGIKPEPSDIGDMHQVVYFPYCREIVIEKSMAGILYQLKRERGILPNTSIKTIKFIRSL